MQQPARFLFAAITLGLVAGCDASSARYASPNTTESAEPAPAEVASEAAADVELSILSFDEIQRLIADQRGKVVVMDAWSTSCAPCLKDFHNLVELHRQYGPDDLAPISLSFDYEGIGGTSPESVSGPVLDFLRSQGATFDNVISSEDSDALYRKFELNAVPAIFVYDRTGKLRARFENEGAYDEVRPLVARLVEEDPAADPSSETP